MSKRVPTRSGARALTATPVPLGLASTPGPQERARSGHTSAPPLVPPLLTSPPTGRIDATAQLAAAVPSEPPVDLPAELVDALAALLLGATGADGRGAAIAAVVDEMAATLVWLHGSRGDHPELASLGRIVGEAQAHSAKVRPTAADGAARGR